MRIEVRAPDGEAERARALMLELFPEGFEEAPTSGALGLAGYCPEARVAPLVDALADTGWSVELNPVLPGWASAWQRFHRPVVIDELWLGPSWETPPPGLQAVWLEPGMAFGTGAHATTQLCVELLLKEERCPLVDLGCGSGVLSVVGAAVGFDPVTAVDQEAVAIAETRANAEKNDLAIRVHQGDVRELDLPPPSLVVANLPADVALETLSELAPARAIVSGYRADAPLISAAYAALERRELDGWGAALLARA